MSEERENIYMRSPLISHRYSPNAADIDIPSMYKVA